MKYQALYSLTRKNRMLSAAFVFGTIRVDPFLSTDTAHKRTNEWNIVDKDVKFTENVYPLNLISMLKYKVSLNIFYPLSFSFNADFQNINAEIPFDSPYLELCEFRPLI